MASEILGLFTSPEQYQANQMAQFRQRAANEVQLDPFQQAAIGMRQAGYQLGGGIAGALGGTDPQLQIIARRQALAGQLDPNNPQSYMQVARMAADAGDQEFAITIADAGRKALSEFALIQQRTREKLGADPFEQLVRTGKYTPASLAAYKTSQNVADLELIEKPTKETPANIKEIGVAEGTRSPVYLDVNNDQQFIYQNSPDGKQVRVPYIGGVDRSTATTKVTATATLPGVKEFKDIPKLRSEIIGVVDPFRKAVNATDAALESLDLSITQNNFSGFNAARVQLAKALSGGDLSQKEIAAAGGDPSVLGGLIDLTSTAFTGTPSLDTQNKIKNTINAIRKVALKKGRDEIDAQRNIATRSGFNAEDFSAASDIPEFRPRSKKVPIETKPFDADKERRYQEWKAKQTQSGAK
jgi:hypothetical protein